MKKGFKRLMLLMMCMVIFSAVPVMASTRASRLIGMYDAYVEPSGDAVGELFIYARVDTLYDCEELEVVYVDLYEQQDNGVWMIVDTWSSLWEDYNTAYVYEYYQGEVGRKYYVDAEFRVKDGDIEEIRYVTSSSTVCE